MNTFFDLVGFEFKKMLCRKRTVIVLALVIIVSALSVFGTIIGNVYYNDGKTVVSKYEDDMMIRQNRETISGRIIDADLIMEAVETYKGMLAADDSRVRTPEYQYSLRKYDEIYRIVCKAFRLNGIEEFCALTRDRAEQFDEVRRNNAVNGSVSDNMQNYQQKCIERSPATLTYEYWGGYYRFVTIMYTTAIMAGATIAVMLSGIFSDEYTSGADSLILSSRHGKGLVIGAKLFTAFAVSAALIILLSVITLIETMSVWGTNGENGMLALANEVFPYPITIGQAVLLYFICMLMGCVMFAAITALLSAKLKLPFNTIVIMIVLLIAPMFISVPDGMPVWIYCLENLLPTNMFAFGGAMYQFQYEIFGLVIPPYVFLPIFALIVAVVCSYFAYRGFRKHQVI
ncbi:MAG: ABC transporter permease [Bacteroides sp.]|nr:ABC transporter permease [Bacteroides sp.]